MASRSAYLQSASLRTDETNRRDENNKVAEDAIRDCKVKIRCICLSRMEGGGVGGGGGGQTLVAADIRFLLCAQMLSIAHVGLS